MSLGLIGLSNIIKYQCVYKTVSSAAREITNAVSNFVCREI